MVIADVFEGGRTPAHLTSAEFWAAARRVLRDTGVVAANVADGAPLSTPGRRSRRRGRSSRTPA